MPKEIKISVCMALYSRPERRKVIEEQLRTQTFQDFEFLVWDNTQNNQGSQARFWLVKEAKGEAIVFIDDDESLEPDFLEYMWGQYQKHPKHLLGWWTRIFNGKDYFDSIAFSPYGTLVDYVGTGGCIVAKKIFDDNTELYAIPEEFRKVEDLYLSYVARREGYTLMALDPKIRIEEDGRDQSISLSEYKNNAYRKLYETSYLCNGKWNG